MAKYFCTPSVWHIRPRQREAMRLVETSRWGLTVTGELRSARDKNIKKTYRMIKGEVPDEPFTVPVGQARVARSGEDVTAIVYGLMFHETLKAAEELAGEGVNVEVIDLRTLHLLDKDTILNSVQRTGKAIIVMRET